MPSRNRTPPLSRSPPSRFRAEYPGRRGGGRVGQRLHRRSHQRRHQGVQCLHAAGHHPSYWGCCHPNGVAVDGSGNVYFADSYNSAIDEWNASTNLVTTLVSTGLNTPSGVAVDGAGNVYFADTFNNAIKEWTTPPPRQVTTLVSTGLNTPKAWRWTGRATSTSPIPTTTRSRSATPPPSRSPPSSPPG